MRTAEKVKKLIGEGVPARQVAEQLGVRRQYVYAVCKQEGLELPSPLLRPIVERLPPEPRKPTDPKPRIITGGIPIRLGHLTIGRVAELLTAADLLARGWHVFMPVRLSQGHDIVAAKGDRIITVEVRSGARTGAGKIHFARKPNDKSSHYACVITGEPVQYFPAIDSDDLFN